MRKHFCILSRHDLCAKQGHRNCWRIQNNQEKEKFYKPVLYEANCLAILAQSISNPFDLANYAAIRGALLTAASISAKAEEHLDNETKMLAIHQFIEQYLLPAENSFREELVSRFLQARIDHLSNALHSVLGLLAQRRFVITLTTLLRNRDMTYSIRVGKEKTWTQRSRDDVPEYSDEIKFISWQTLSNSRILAFNQTIPFIGNSIDVSLLNCSTEHFSAKLYDDKSLFLAFGELKGGIDPAGADEHWKTANSALDRIRKTFVNSRHQPALFFVGAAIEQAMAEEIWTQLNNGLLNNAANLTIDAQLSAICDWLVSM